jgi:AraC-like DNA-binding protein
MNLQSYFLLLPCIAGFFWVLAYLLFASRGVVYRKMMRFLLTTACFLLFAILSLDESRRLLMHFTLFKQFCALLMIPYFLNYIYALKGIKPVGIIYTILGVVPYIQLIVGIESVYSIGYENALRIIIDTYTFQGPMFPYLPSHDQQVFYACYTYMFRAFLLLGFLVFSINLMKCAISGYCTINEVGSFFFRGRRAPIRPAQFLLALLLFLILVPALLLGRKIYIDSLLITVVGSVLIAVIISLIAFIGTAGRKERQSIPGILKTVRFGVQYEDDPELVPESQEDTTPEAMMAASGINPDEQVVPVEHPHTYPDNLNKLRDELDVKLKQVVEGERLFLNRDLSITAVADRMGVFKDELADFIDFKYGVSFQNYINMLRIRYAEKYIMQHDDVTQKDIALACGFSGASSFNSAFSKQNGVTPKIWKDRQLESGRNQEA